MIMRIEVPKKVEKIIETLQEKGYDAYAVGGCVRDSLLGRVPADWDITTSAKPMEVKALFRRTVDTGLQHGTVTVLMDREGFEVTTYRIDGEYEDSRHPKEVIFTGELEEDLRRRDFTINAMAYNHRTGLVDVFGGERDLKAGIVRCVGSPKERFTEDALRILRAVRFSAQLGFEIEEKTGKAASALVENLKNISAERIQTELLKLLTSPHPDYLKKAWELGITRVILPEFDAMMETSRNNFCLGEHTLEALKHVKADKVLRLAVLFHDMGKPGDEEGNCLFEGLPDRGEELAVKILKRLKLDNDTISKTRKLVLWHERSWENTREAVRRAMSEIGPELFPLLLETRGAVLLAQDGGEREEKLEELRSFEEFYREILEKGECISLKTLAVSGKDLIAAGMKPGKEIGETLDFLLDQVLKEPEKNTKEYLLSLLKENQEDAIKE